MDRFGKNILSLSLSLSLLCNHANSRLRLLRAFSRARVFPVWLHIHLLHVYTYVHTYICMRDSADCRPVHPPPRLCPWLLHTIPVCEGGGPDPTLRAIPEPARAQGLRKRVGGLLRQSRVRGNWLRTARCRNAQPRDDHHPPPPPPPPHDESFSFLTIDRRLIPRLHPSKRFYVDRSWLLRAPMRAIRAEQDGRRCPANFDARG